MTFTYNGMLLNYKMKLILWFWFMALIYATVWMNFENIILSEISHTQNDKYCMISFMWNNLELGKFIETKSRGYQALGGSERIESCCLMCIEFLCEW